MSIKAGDLVVCVKDCCGTYLGRIKTVDTFINGTSIKCDKCKKIIRDGRLIKCATFTDHKLMWTLPVSWLRRIDPLPESETQNNHESMPA